MSQIVTIDTMPAWGKHTKSSSCLEDFQGVGKRGTALVVLLNAFTPMGQAYLDSLIFGDWQKKGVQGSWGGSYSRKLVVGGFHRDPNDSGEACDQLEDLAKDFFPNKKHLDVFLTALSRYVAKFAAVANSRAVEIVFKAEDNSGDDNDSPLKFKAAPDNQLQGEINLRGLSQVFTDHSKCTQDVLDSIRLGKLSPEDAMVLEQTALRFPKGSFVICQGLATAKPHLGEDKDSLRLSISLTPSGTARTRQTRHSIIGHKGHTFMHKNQNV